MLWFQLLRYARQRRWIWVVFDDGGHAKVLPQLAWPGWLKYAIPKQPGTPDLESVIIRTNSIIAILEEYIQGEAARLQALFDSDSDNQSVGLVMDGDDDEDDEDDDGDGDIRANR